MKELAGIVNTVLRRRACVSPRDQTRGKEKGFVGLHTYQLIFFATTALNYLCRTKAKMKGGKDSALPGFLHAAHRPALCVRRAVGQGELR